jgi:hypothetical protein
MQHARDQRLERRLVHALAGDRRDHELVTLD